MHGSKKNGSQAKAMDAGHYGSGQSILNGLMGRNLQTLHERGRVGIEELEHGNKADNEQQERDCGSPDDHRCFPFPMTIFGLH